MGIEHSEVNYNNLINNLGNCCLTESICGTCKEGECLIGYGKKCVVNCLKEGVTYIIDGQANIPYIDGKVYDISDLIDATADVLKQCKNCDKNHFDNCLINVLRNCYEILLLGEMQEYKGSNLLYLDDIKSVDEKIAKELLKRL